MTKLTFFSGEKSFLLDELPILSFVCESKSLLLDYCDYLFNEFIGKERYWKLEIDGEVEELFEKGDFIQNYFQLDLNSKRNINALYKILKKLYYEKLSDSMEELKEKALSIVKEIALDFDIELSVNNDIKEDDLFKIMNLQFSDDGLSYKEKLIKYIFITNELRGVNIFFVTNFHRHFLDDEANEILKELSYRKIRLVNLEYDQNFAKYDGESLLLVDQDLCVF